MVYLRLFNSRHCVEEDEYRNAIIDNIIECFWFIVCVILDLAYYYKDKLSISTWSFIRQAGKGAGGQLSLSVSLNSVALLIMKLSNRRVRHVDVGVALN